MSEVNAKHLEELVLGIGSFGYEFLSPLGPLIIASAAMDIADNSRGFSRMFEVEHALVIRECNYLDQECALIHTEIHRQNSQRIYYRLTNKALAMINAIRKDNEFTAS